MAHLFTYRNRKISTGDVKYIRHLIKAHPEFGRCRLSREIFTFWEWIQPNDHLKDTVNRSINDVYGYSLVQNFRDKLGGIQ
jgi:hypothetical protein